MGHKFSAEIQTLVRQRANYLCEYCRVSEEWQCVDFTIDHLNPQAEGGTHELDNLALACFKCNRRKSKIKHWYDPDTGEMVPLFNPRQQLWTEHFRWSEDGLYVVPKTATGRATRALLDLNRNKLVRIRAREVKADNHPPAFDLPFIK